jgi:hypothetical protein
LYTYWTKITKSLIFIGHAYRYYNGTCMQSTRPRFTFSSFTHSPPPSLQSSHQCLLVEDLSPFFQEDKLFSFCSNPVTVTSYSACIQNYHAYFSECSLSSHCNYEYKRIAGFWVCNLCVCAFIWLFKNAILSQYWCFNRLEFVKCLYVQHILHLKM